MKKKPDLLWILAMLLGLGVVTTGYTKSIWEQTSSHTAPPAYKVQTILAPHTNTDQ